MNMWRVFTCFGLVLAISFSAVADEDKPQADESSIEKSSSEEKTSEKDKQTTSDTTAQAPRAPARDFLKLAEPKSPTEKTTKKNLPWGGYWSAIFRRAPDEEEEEPLESRALQPKVVKPEEKPPSLAEYKEVDFARFASGSYASDYGGKYVKFRCRFASLSPEGMRLQDFPPPEYLNFIVVSPGSSMENLTVAARAGLGDKIFRIESGKEITLYGRAHRLGLSGLTLVVDEIETGKK